MIVLRMIRFGVAEESKEKSNVRQSAAELPRVRCEGEADCIRSKCGRKFNERSGREGSPQWKTERDDIGRCPWMKASKNLEYPGSDPGLLHVKQIYKKNIGRATGVADAIMTGNGKTQQCLLGVLMR